MANIGLGATVLAKRLKGRKLPTVEIPNVAEAELNRALEGIKEHLRMYEGDSGAPKERFVTIAELENAGLITAQTKNKFSFIAEVQGVPVSQPSGTTDAAVINQTIINQGGGGGGVDTLLGLTDTEVTGQFTKEFLQYSGGKWRNFDLFNSDSIINGNWTHTDDIDMSGAAINWLDSADAEVELLTFVTVVGVDTGNLMVQLVFDDGTEGGNTITNQGLTSDPVFLADGEIRAVAARNGLFGAYIHTSGTGFGTSPMAITANGQTDPFSMASNDYTIAFDVQLREEAGDGYLIECQGTTQFQWSFQRIGGEIRFRNQNAAMALMSAPTISLLTWYHIAVVKEGDTLYMFKEGVLVDTYDATGEPWSAQEQIFLNFGRFQSEYIDNVLLVKGQALWTATFTPPVDSGSGTTPTVDTFIVGDPTYPTVIEGLPTTFSGDTVLQGDATLDGALAINWRAADQLAHGFLYFSSGLGPETFTVGDPAYPTVIEGLTTTITSAATDIDGTLNVDGTSTLHGDATLDTNIAINWLDNLDASVELAVFDATGLLAFDPTYTEASSQPLPGPRTITTNDTWARAWAYAPGKSTGKWVIEIVNFTSESVPNLGIGFSNDRTIGAQYVGQDANSWGYLGDGYKTHSGYTNISLPMTTSPTSAAMVYIDLDAGSIGVKVDNGTETVMFTGQSFGTVFPGLSINGPGSSRTGTINFGGAAFTNTLPSGYAAWDSSASTFIVGDPAYPTVIEGLTTTITSAATDIDGTLNVDGAATFLSSFSLSGKLNVGVTIVTTTSHTAADEHVILVDDDTAAATVTVTLPAAAAADTIYHIKKLGTTALVIVEGDGAETIDGALTATLTTQYESIMLVSDGVEWHVI